MSRSVSLRESFAVQGRVIHALLLREVLTRFGRENIGVLWLVGEPMIFTLGIVALWTFTGAQHGSSIPIAAFAITGYSSVLVWRNTVNQCNSGIHSNLSLLYHRNVRVIDVFITRILIEIAGATGSFAILSCVFTSLGWISLPRDGLTVLAGWVLLCWFGAALGILMGSASTYSELVHRLWHPASYLLFPLSGAGFMVDWLPPSAQKVVMLVPMVHGVELVREGYFGNTVRTHYDIPYVCTVNLALTLAGLFVMRDASRKVGNR